MNQITDPTTAPVAGDRPALPDLRPQLLRALDVVDGLVRGLYPGAGDLDRPTPCEDFAVRDLLDHLVMVVRRIRVVTTGGRFDDVPQSLGLPDAELAPAWSAGLAELRETLPTIDLAATAVVPFGTVPNAAAVGSYVGELVVHGWDLAVALGRTELLDPTLADGPLATARQRIPRETRGVIPFGEVVDVPDDAPALDRLVGWMGRDPGWTAPTS